jgi:hypothetical protein
VLCYGKGGHKSPQCKFKSKPKEEWAINKAKKEDQSHATAAVPATTQGSIAPTNAQTQQNAAAPTVMLDITGWILGHQMKDVILLDNQSTTDIFCNPALVEIIRQTSETLTLATNAGNLKADLVGDVPGYGTVWFHPKALTNIFSVANMSPSATTSRMKCLLSSWNPTRKLNSRTMDTGFTTLSHLIRSSPANKSMCSPRSKLKS